MKNRTRLMFSMLLFTLVLTFAGCGKSGKSSDKNKVTPNFYVYDTNEFSVAYEEKFDKDYYDKAELEAIIDEELKEFNSNYVSEENKGIEKDSIVMSDKNIVLKLNFHSWENYVTYASEYVNSERNAKLYMGTYEEAIAAGYNFAGKFTSKDGKESYDLSEASSDLKVIYTNQGFNMKIDGEIVAINENVSLVDGVIVTSEKRENYIIYNRKDINENEK